MVQRTRPATLYRLFNADDDLLYVGIAGNPGRRFGQHAEDKPWWSAVSTIRLEHFETREEARAAELEAIAMELPAHNKADIRADKHAVRLHPGTAAQFADCCGRCRDDRGDFTAHLPLRAYADSSWLTAAYRCDTWTCGWSWRSAA